jgi:HAD superfamily phosphoserine phosphatase-like hydrolase
VSPARAPIASVVFDVDSTLTGIEGVDWLADRRDAATAGFVHRLTDAVMAGELPIERAYAARLDRIAPTRDEMHALATAYGEHAAPGAAETIAALRHGGVRVVAISGGLLEAVGPFCVSLGIGEQDVHAVAVQWTALGAYAGFDRASPLVTQTGKAVLLDRLALPRAIIAVGDGSTDVEMKRTGAADLFAAYVGFARRDRAVAAADFVLETCAQLLAHVTRGP